MTKQAIYAYGWPDAFRKDDFNRDIEQLQERWTTEGNALMKAREERHDQIAATLSKIYQSLVQIGYITTSEVSWPKGRDDSVLHCNWLEAGYSDLAIDLIKQIPWMTTGDQLVWNSPDINFSLEGDIEESRHPVQAYVDMPSFGEEFIETISANEVPLTLSTPGEFEGNAFVVDANTGMLQWRDDTNGGGREWEDAVEELQKLYADFTSLEWVPVGGKILVRCSTPLGGYFPEPEFDKAKAGLIEYGWPDSFRREEWRRDVWESYKKWEQEACEEYGMEEREKKAQVGEMRKLQLQEEPSGQ